MQIEINSPLINHNPNDRGTNNPPFIWMASATWLEQHAGIIPDGNGVCDPYESWEIEGDKITACAPIDIHDLLANIVAQHNSSHPEQNIQPAPQDVIDAWYKEQLLNPGGNLYAFSYDKWSETVTAMIPVQINGQMTTTRVILSVQQFNELMGRTSSPIPPPTLQFATPTQTTPYTPQVTTPSGFDQQPINLDAMPKEPEPPATDSTPSFGISDILLAYINYLKEQSGIDLLMCSSPIVLSLLFVVYKMNQLIRNVHKMGKRYVSSGAGYQSLDRHTAGGVEGVGFGETGYPNNGSWIIRSDGRTVRAVDGSRVQYINDYLTSAILTRKTIGEAALIADGHGARKANSRIGAKGQRGASEIIAETILNAKQDLQDAQRVSDFTGRPLSERGIDAANCLASIAQQYRNAGDEIVAGMTGNFGGLEDASFGKHLGGDGT